MAAAPKTILRPLTDREFQELTRMDKATSERLDVVRRSKALLEVAKGASFSLAARIAGFKTGDGVVLLVKRFNDKGLAALEIASGRGPKPTYGPAARQKIVETLRQPPDRTEDQTATWSLTTLERSLRRNEPDLTNIGATTIARIARQAGFSYQKSRSWCQTGTVKRKRKAGVVTVTDPRTEEKKV
jgi:transposase